MTVRDLQKNVKECVDEAQNDRVVITRRGRPAAVLVGVEGDDWEAVMVQTDPAFWKLVRARKSQPTISLRELKTSLGVERPSRAAASKRGVRGSTR
ncbi:MAG: type II toxin-antitoxin system Phd/YefM family antitoxin [Candidatus Rokuibacteriota bacterium]